MPSPLRPGQTVRSFRVERYICTGGMSEVYLARDSRGDRVVVKVSRDGDPKVASASRRALSLAAHVLRGLEHPSVVRLVDAWDDGRRFYLVTKFVDGPSLSQLAGKLGPEQVREVVLQVLEALSAVHRAGYAVVDVKPSNVIVGDRAVLVDFSSVRPIGRPAPVISGTPGYECPEVRQSAIDQRCDLYSVGRVLLDLISGRSGGIWSRLRGVAERASAESPGARYGSADQMADDLRRAVPLRGPAVFLGVKMFPVSSSLTVGRDPSAADLAVEDPNRYVDPAHARISRSGGRVSLEDLNSTNGTFVFRGAGFFRVTASTPLRDGDVIALCYSPSRGPYRMLTFRER